MQLLCERGGDADTDGISDAAEAVLGTDPERPDTDGDGLPDERDRCPRLDGARLPSSTTQALELVMRTHLEHMGVDGDAMTALRAALDPQQPAHCFRSFPGVQVHEAARDTEWGRSWPYLWVLFDGAERLPPQPAQGEQVTLELWLGAAMFGCAREYRLVYTANRWEVVDVRVTGCA